MEPEDRNVLPQSSSMTHAAPSGFRGASSSARGWPSSSEVGVEQSPVANTAQSDCSWHDDASSSLATCSAADRTIIVNTQRMRMGEHLKGKLESMIRQRFENYLQIMHVLQNETGKLASLVCELAPLSDGVTGLPARISISCNEDGTFLVYAAPEAAAHTGPSDCANATLPSISHDLPLSSTNGVHDSENACAVCGVVQLLRRWVEQVCEFGMSGRCQSLTALFHFGYTIWSATKRQDGMPAKIAEEEERSKDELRDDVRMMPNIQEPASTATVNTSGPSMSSGGFPPTLAIPEVKDGPPVERLLMAAQKAADTQQYDQALDLCAEALTTVAGEPPGSEVMAEPLSWSLAGASVVGSSNGRAGSPPSMYSRERGASSAGFDRPLDAEAALSVQQILLLRASIQVMVRRFDLALQDAEKLISIQPTCAEAYYWQSIALQGMDHGQEALEALMSALEYDPQNALFQQAFTALFEDISSTPSPAAAPPAARPVLHGRRSRGGQLGDALSMTTQATHLSSRSTTPTEVSAPQSRSSSQDSLYIIGETTGEPPT